MITVLVVDDDPAVRAKALQYLARPEVRLASSANGRLALADAARLQPDVVICDVDMPEMDGFELLQALRADPVLNKTLVMMLTAESSRDSMRLGMTLGADDYLTKPFTGEELVTAFEGLMRKRGRIDQIVDAAARAQGERLHGVFSKRFDGATATDASQRVVIPLAGDGRDIIDATVLHCDLRNFTDIAVKLTSEEIERLMTGYCDRISVPVLAAGGHHVCFSGNRLFALFSDSPDQPIPAAQRALSAASAMNAAAQALTAWARTEFGDSGLPAVDVGFGLHAGEVSISPNGTSFNDALPRGDTVDIAATLGGAGQGLGWTIVGSDTVAQRAGKPAVGESTWLLNSRSGTVPAIEFSAWEDTFSMEDGESAGAAGQALSAALHVQAVENAHITAHAVKSALEQKLASFKNYVFSASGPQLYLADYRLLRRIGGGAVSSVYLAAQKDGGQLLALKVLEQQGAKPDDQMARFNREYQLLSGISHPNVINILNRGFSNQHAYIAMEYFENGDLRSRLDGPLAPHLAVTAVLDVAKALAATHSLGIVHRDIKPENLMVRSDGTIVLADFGIAKSMASYESGASVLTHTGGFMGSPSYASPEQIAGKELGTGSDLYSLGILFFELLTGSRPYQAANILDLMGLHVRAPIPQLPAHLARWQPVINRLLDKDPARRYPSALALVEVLERLR